MRGFNCMALNSFLDKQLLLGGGWLLEVVADGGWTVQNV